MFPLSHVWLCYLSALSLLNSSSSCEIIKSHISTHMRAHMHACTHTCRYRHILAAVTWWFYGILQYLLQATDFFLSLLHIMISVFLMHHTRNSLLFQFQYWGKIKLLWKTYVIHYNIDRNLKQKSYSKGWYLFMQNCWKLQKLIIRNAINSHIH